MFRLSDFGKKSLRRGSSGTPLKWGDSTETRAFAHKSSDAPKTWSALDQVEASGWPSEASRAMMVGAGFTGLHIGGLPCSRVTLRLNPNRSNRARLVLRAPMTPDHPLAHLQVA